MFLEIQLPTTTTSLLTSPLLQCDLIVTDDRHFRVLKKINFPKVVAMKLSDFQNFEAR
ncbi:MAG: hypothetical protein IPJ82_00895 [Lewinellaceae bacterium]|nr:hypothetical protein [Lewinellaceae bacterium]